MAYDPTQIASSIVRIVFRHHIRCKCRETAKHKGTSYRDCRQLNKHAVQYLTSGMSSAPAPYSQSNTCKAVATYRYKCLYQTLTCTKHLSIKAGINNNLFKQSARSYRVCNRTIHLRNSCQNPSQQQQASHGA